MRQDKIRLKYVGCKFPSLIALDQGYLCNINFNLSDLGNFSDPKFPTSWQSTVKLLFLLGMSGTEIIYVCDKADHVHIFKDNEVQCPTCNEARRNCATQSTLSITQTLKRELGSPI